MTKTTKPLTEKQEKALETLRRFTGGNAWMTAQELAKELGYKNPAPARQLARGLVTRGLVVVKGQLFSVRKKKAAPKKTAPKKARGQQILDHPAGQVGRWMGAEGWTSKEIAVVFDHLGVSASKGSITNMVSHGRKPEKYGLAIAKLTNEEASTLQQVREEVAS